MTTVDENRHCINRQEACLDNLTCIRSMLRNLPEIWQHAGAQLAPVPSDALAVVCTYGASLLSQLDKIKQYAGRVLLIADSRAAAVMVDEGIYPRVVVATDAWAEEYWQVPLHLDDSLLVAPPECDPCITKRFSSYIWVRSERQLVNGLLDRMGIQLPQLFETGGPADRQLLQVACRLGCRKMLLVGYDYCLDAYGRSFPEEIKVAEHEVVEMPGVDGRMVQTTHALVAASQRFQEALHDCLSAENGCELVVNGTRRGIRLEGAVSCSLHELLDSQQAYHSLNPIHIDRSSSAPELQAGPLLEVVAVLRQVVGSFYAQRGKASYARLRQEVENMQSCGRLFLVETARLMESVCTQFTEADSELMRLFFHDLASEFLTETGYTLSCILRTGENFRRADNVHRYTSLTSLGCGIIRRSNPELATYIAESGGDRLPPELSVAWRHQGAPDIKCMMQGDFGAITEAGEGPEPVKRAVARFIEKYTIDPARNSVIILGPADWRHVDVLAALMPDLKLMVVEPWVELLSQQLERRDLLSWLPRDTLVIGMDQRIASWAVRYSQRINLWRAEQVSPVFYVPPMMRRVTKIRTCYSMLERLA